MKRKIVSYAVASVFLAGSVAAYAANESAWRKEPIQPIQPVKEVNLAKAHLGKQLFFDGRLSRSGILSCDTCHNLAQAGVDNLQYSVGDRWKLDGINTPTVYNSSLNFVQFWNGRAPTLQAQAGGPIGNPVEMGGFSHVLTVDVLNTIPGYVTEFKQVYGEDSKITFSEVTGAIAEFEKMLKTPNGRFDRWLMGDDNAIDAKELAGYRLFKSIGCIACHNGQGVGGNSYQKFGVMAPYKTKNPAEGRYDVTRKNQDRMKFKVPMLRNVALTYPYFHDGAARTLHDAVETMGRIQLGRKLTPQENGEIVAFLKTLTGEFPDITLPHLPAGSDKTPESKPFAGTPEAHHFQ